MKLSDFHVHFCGDHRQLFVHGFVLDDKGKKMSKSLGNVVDPQHITDGDGKKRLAYGADVLR